MSGVSGTERIRGLIETAMRLNGWSYQDIADRGGMSKSTVGNLATRRKRERPMSDGLIRQLALGLQLPYERVQEAALVDAGLTVITGPELPPEAVLLTDAMQHMTPEKRQRYLSLALELSKEYRD